MANEQIVIDDMTYEATTPGTTLTVSDDAFAQIHAINKLADAIDRLRRIIK